MKDVEASQAVLSASELPYKDVARMLLMDAEDRVAVAALVAAMQPGQRGLICSKSSPRSLTHWSI